jgi:hypothetical protein
MVAVAVIAGVLLWPHVASARNEGVVGEHDEEGVDDLDNRRDPSGGWASHIGVLSLMHTGDALSWSYSAVFGPTAHLCDGAGVAGLVGRDRYEFPDDEGTVAFVIEKKGVHMEVVEGVASFCGAGWAGDELTRDGFKPPEICTVVAERSHFHVVDHLDPERRPAYVIRGDRVEIAPARHESGGGWVLARFVGPTRTTVGLLAQDDLDCPSMPFEEER